VKLKKKHSKIQYCYVGIGYDKPIEKQQCLTRGIRDFSIVIGNQMMCRINGSFIECKIISLNKNDTWLVQQVNKTQQHSLNSHLIEPLCYNQKPTEEEQNIIRRNILVDNHCNINQLHYTKFAGKGDCLFLLFAQVFYKNQFKKNQVRKDLVYNYKRILVNIRHY